MVSPVDYRTTPEYATAARRCGEVITDILASVPYNFGWHLNNKNGEESRSAEGSGGVGERNLGFGCGKEEVGNKGLAGLFLSWPLSCVMGQDYCTDAREYFPFPLFS